MPKRLSGDPFPNDKGDIPKVVALSFIDFVQTQDRGAYKKGDASLLIISIQFSPLLRLPNAF